MADIPKHEQRIPFGKNGIMDGNGRIIRTDHPTFMEAVEGLLKGAAPKSLQDRKRKINKEVDKAVDGVAAIKKIQDEFAGITRRDA